MPESHFKELCGLRQLVVAWAMRRVVSGPVGYSAAYFATTVLYIRFQARSHNCEKRLLSFVMSVRMQQLGSTGLFIMKFVI